MSVCSDVVLPSAVVALEFDEAETREEIGDKRVARPSDVLPPDPRDPGLERGAAYVPEQVDLRRSSDHSAAE